MNNVIAELQKQLENYKAETQEVTKLVNYIETSNQENQ